MCISVKKITHFRIIYNEVLLTRQTPRGNAIWCILCAAENNRTSPKTHQLKKMLEKVIDFFAELWYVLWLPRDEQNKS